MSTKHLSAFLIILFFSLTSFSQDIIVLQNGDEILAKVMDIGITEIKYKKHENLSGPQYTILKADVFMIKYENGSKDVFKKTASTNNDNSTQPGNSNSQPSSQPTSTNGSDLASKIEFYNQVYVLSGGALTALEKGTPESKITTIATPFYAGSTSSWVMAGDRSNVRLSSAGGYAFVIKISPGTDPFGFIRLVKFQVQADKKSDPGKKSRYMINTKTSGSIGGASSSNITEFDVPFELKKISDTVYQIIPNNALPQGEFTFYILHKFFAFGIN